MEIAHTDLENIIKINIYSEIKTINNFEIYEMLF